MAAVTAPCPEVHAGPSHVVDVDIDGDLSLFEMVERVVTCNDALDGVTDKQTYFQSTVGSDVNACAIDSLRAVGCRLATVKGVDELGSRIGRNSNQLNLESLFIFSCGFVCEDRLHRFR